MSQPFVEHVGQNVQGHQDAPVGRNLLLGKRLSGLLQTRTRKWARERETTKRSGKSKIESTYLHLKTTPQQSAVPILEVHSMPSGLPAPHSGPSPSEGGVPGNQNPSHKKLNSLTGNAVRAIKLQTCYLWQSHLN